MSDDKKSWDDIPSLNLQMDDEYDSKLKQSEDSRRHHRANIEALKTILPYQVESLPIRVGTAARGVFNGEIIDLSKSGVRIKIPKVLDKGELTKVGFIINKRTITSDAVTKWVSPDDDGGCIAGMNFKNMPKDIASFIDDISSADLFNKLAK